MRTLVVPISHGPAARDAVPLVAAALVVLWTLRLALRGLLATGRKRAPAKREASEFAESIDPTPSYLAGSIDDADIIGGDPSCIHSLRGPDCHTLIFRAYTPPSLDGEIPKVDLYGAVNFVRTGRVRTFVPKGARRLLRVDLRGRTVGVHVPKQAKRRRRRASRPERRSYAEAALFSGDNGQVAKAGSGQRSGGIRISARRLSFDPEDLDRDDNEPEESEEDWNPQKYEPAPSLLLDLDGLISVSAVPPRCGGVVEIVSHSRVAGSSQKSSDRMADDGTGRGERGESGRGGVKTKEKNGSVSPRKKPPKLDESKEERLCPNGVEQHKGLFSSNGAKKDQGPEYVAKSLEGRDTNSLAGYGQQRNEFAFPSPRDAAEFQRVLMALRVVGREISWIYEALETLEPSLLPSDEARSEVDAHDVFASPGVLLDDALGSLGEMSMLRRGLDRLGHLVRAEERDRRDDGVLLDGSGEGPCPQPLLGIVDFFSLFVPPLPEDGLEILPGISPCARSGSLGNRNGDVAGIEWHHQRLGFVLALQRLVSRASLFVKTYISTRNIIRDGWALDESGCVNQEEGSNSDGNGDISSSDAANQTPKAGANDASCRPAAVLASGDGSSLPTDGLPRGYTCVGWHVFRMPSPDSETESSVGSSWPSPETDPLEQMPGLRSVVEKHPYAHFFVFSHFNEQRNVVACFLLVRSFPVGVDRAFDRAMNKLISGSAREREKRLRISLQLGPGKDSSLTTRVAFRVLRGLCREGAQTRNGQSGQMVWLSESLAAKVMSMWHHGDGMHSNYIAVNAQLSLKQFPSLRILRACLRQTSSVDLTYGLAASANDLLSERSIASICLKCVNVSQFLIGTNGHILPLLQNRGGDSGSNTRATAFSPNDELYRHKIDTILELLGDVAVPLRKSDQSRGEHNPDNRGEILAMGRARVTRSDAERYLIACECDLRATISRMVESATWRSIVFPVDTRLCDIELQSGQFFQHGRDKEGNTIFYFRNILLGPSRDNVCATVLSALHHLETYLAKADKQRPGIKITVIALLDNALQRKGQKNASRGRNAAEGPAWIARDPRIDPYEEYYPHSNITVMQLLNDLIARHYPGRIAKTLVVSNKGWKKARFLRSLFQNATILSSAQDLRKYVDKEELCLAELWQ